MCIYGIFSAMYMDSGWIYLVHVSLSIHVLKGLNGLTPNFQSSYVNAIESALHIDLFEV